VPKTHRRSQHGYHPRRQSYWPARAAQAVGLRVQGLPLVAAFSDILTPGVDHAAVDLRGRREGLAILREALKDNPIKSLVLQTDLACYDELDSALKSTLVPDLQLDLGGTTLGDGHDEIAAKAIASGGASITHIDLTRTLVTHVSMTHISGALTMCPRLGVLALGKNNIGDEGAKILSLSLMSHCAIATLDLRDNGIGSNGAGELAELCAQNTNVAELRLGGNEVGGTGAVALADAIDKRDGTLNVSGLRFVSVLSALRRGKELPFCGEGVLDLSGCDIGDKGIGALLGDLQRHPEVTIAGLVLCNNGIADDGARALAKVLTAYADAQRPSFAHVDLANNRITHDGVGDLCRAIEEDSTLAKVDITNNPVDGIAEFPITGTTKTVCIMRSVVALGNAKLGNRGTIAIAAAIRLSPMFAEVHLNSTSIGDPGARAIGFALRANTSIHTLNISHNEFGELGAVALADGIRGNRTLSQLDIRGNKIGLSGAFAMKHLEVVRSATVNVRGCPDVPPWCHPLLDPTCSTAEFTSSTIGNTVAVFAECLKYNRSVKTVTVNRCKVELPDAIALVEALEVNSVVEVVDLRECDVDVVAQRALADHIIVTGVEGTEGSGNGHRGGFRPRIVVGKLPTVVPWSRPAGAK